MENRKEIGKAFKDKLANLDKSPSDALWNSIEKDLDKKKKKRILFWLFPVLFFVGTIATVLYVNQKQTAKSIENKVETSTNKNSFKNNLLSKNMKDSCLQKVKSENVFKEKQSEGLITKSNFEAKAIENSQLEEKVKNQNSLEQDQDRNKQIANNDTKTNQNKTKRTETKRLVSETKKTIVYNDNYEEYEVVKKYKIQVKKYTSTISKKNILKKKLITKKQILCKNKSKANTNKFAYSKNKKQKETTSIVSNEKPFIEKEIISNSATIEVEKKDTIEKKLCVVVPNKKMDKPKREFKKDSTKYEEPEKEYDFYGSVFYGPTIFGSMNTESMLNNSFNSIKKGHPITSNYGFYVKSKYNRFGISLGFSKINLKISNKFNSSQKITNFNDLELNNNTTTVNINNTILNNNSTELLQKTSYYGTDLNMYYSLLNLESKYDVEASAGINLLILGENKLLFTSNEFKNIEIGSNKNISKVNLSYNIGLALHYKLTENIYIDCNPFWKYYFSSFNEKSNSKPYSFSIQSGFTYKFQ